MSPQTGRVALYADTIKKLYQTIETKNIKDADKVVMYVPPPKVTHVFSVSLSVWIRFWEGVVTIVFCRKTFSLRCSFTDNDTTPFLLGKEGIFNYFNVLFDNEQKKPSFLFSHQRYNRLVAKKTAKLLTVSYVRTFVFGVEDSLVSTVGLLSGIAVGGVAKPQIILTGVILLLVEAFSMAIGSLISEQSAEEFVKHREVPITNDLFDSAIMFVSYLVFGLIPLSPYLFFTPSQALPLSVIGTLAALFFLGVGGALFFKIHILKNGIRTLILGGSAIAIGILAATWLQNL